MKTALFDNSSFCNLLADSGKMDRLAKVIYSGKVRVVFLMDSLDENVEFKNPEGFKHLAKSLSELGKRLNQIPPDRLILAKNAELWIRKEWEKGGKLKNIPVVRNGQRFPFFLKALLDAEQLKGIVEKSKPEIETSMRVQGVLLAHDKSTRSIMRKDHSDSYIRESLRAFSLPKNLREVDPVMSIYEDLPGYSKRKAKKVLNSKNKYEIFRAHITLMCMRVLGNGLDPSVYDPELSCFYKTVEGNWYDLRYISMASKFDYLVTDDKAQAGITKFAKSKEVVKCDAITLDQFLSELK